MSDLNQCTITGSTTDFIELYNSGLSLAEVADATGKPKSTVRGHLLKEGLLRSNVAGQKLAASKGRMSRYGKRPPFSPEAIQNIGEGARKRAEENSRGWRVTSQGALEHTTGENAGRLHHVVIMEKRLGRRLKPDECVHHIDRNKQNNDENNLALVTFSGNGRLHRFEDRLQGKTRSKDSNGRFKKEMAQ